MLTRLSIRDIVLIDRLDIDFASGLSALTGETGAGKSILLDAFALALGARGDATLVRHGAEQGQVTAVFDLAADHPAQALLAANDIVTEDELILRRVQLTDGRTRAFVNDQPVGVQVLQSLGARWSRFTASTTTARWSMPARIAACSMPMARSRREAGKVEAAVDGAADVGRGVGEPSRRGRAGGARGRLAAPRGRGTHPPGARAGRGDRAGEPAHGDDAGREGRRGSARRA